jgi:ribonuclease-3
VDAFEQKINYEFKNRDLLAEALTHSSYGYENNCPFNERLEFLGDAILGYVISRELFNRYSDKNEGTLSKLKSVLVSAKSLAKKAREIELGGHLRLGKGENKAGGRKKSSILADGMEALIGAVVLDGGLVAGEALILKLFEQEIANITLEVKNKIDFKTLLQERLQEQSLGLPTYDVDSEEGPAHARRFLVRVRVGNYEGPVGKGTSKKNAQQECARHLLEDETFWKQHRG